LTNISTESVLVENCGKQTSQTKMLKSSFNQLLCQTQTITISW